jgi:hypothetical protein
MVEGLQVQSQVKAGGHQQHGFWFFRPWLLVGLQVITGRAMPLRDACQNTTTTTDGHVAIDTGGGPAGDGREGISPMSIVG